MVPTRATIAPETVPAGASYPVTDRPRRTCVGCRTTRTTDELVRVARVDDAKLAIGRTLPGRGAWLCLDTIASCSDRAARTGQFARAFRSAVSAEALSALRPQIDSLAAEYGSRFVPGPPPARD